MRITRSLMAAAGGLVMAGVAPSAFAGSGCYSGVSACNPGMSVTSSPYQTQPMGVHYGQPYDYLTTHQYNQTPQMNVMRVETGAPMTTLGQAPATYWGGCAGGVTCGAPVAQAPVHQAPVVQAPVVAAPRTYVAQGYNPANFAPRQYGDNTFVPGIAHIPTSIVDRSPITRDQALASGRAVAQPVVSSYSSASYASTSVGGWEKVSGPTMIDGMLATEILCKTEPQTQAYQVVRPIVAVPYAVPTPINCDAPQMAQPQMAAPQFQQRPIMNQTASNSRYGSTWSY